MFPPAAFLSGSVNIRIHPGVNVGIGRDDTLFAKIDGMVSFDRLGRDKRAVSVIPEKVAVSS
ncbi:MAG: 50S ribosomal protein L27 [Candidatus Syntrophopropionicum ammoniitolerans]